MGIIKDLNTFSGVVSNGIKVRGIVKNGEIIYRAKPYKIVDFATGTDEEIAAMLDAHYQGLLNIGDYWHVGDTRVMHLNAMPATPPYASESHVEQNMTMVIIGIEHDNLKEKIGIRTQAAITLQCREMLGNNGNAEGGYIFGSNKTTGKNTNYSTNPRRTWLNGTFINSLPTSIQPLVKTIIKKNLANHTDSTSGPNTEDKAFLTSSSEMFGSTSIGWYKGSEAREGKQYPYYNSNAKRTKYWNNNGIAGSLAYLYWLRSPSYSDAEFWMIIYDDGSSTTLASYYSSTGFAPAFCL